MSETNFTHGLKILVLLYQFPVVQKNKPKSDISCRSITLHYKYLGDRANSKTCLRSHGMILDDSLKKKNSFFREGVQLIFHGDGLEVDLAHLGSGEG